MKQLIIIKYSYIAQTQPNRDKLETIFLLMVFAVKTWPVLINKTDISVAIAALIVIYFKSYTIYV